MNKQVRNWRRRWLSEAIQHWESVQLWFFVHFHIYCWSEISERSMDHTQFGGLYHVVPKSDKRVCWYKKCLSSIIFSTLLALTWNIDTKLSFFIWRTIFCFNLFCLRTSTTGSGSDLFIFCFSTSTSALYTKSYIPQRTSI